MGHAERLGSEQQGERKGLVILDVGGRRRGRAVTAVGRGGRVAAVRLGVGLVARRKMHGGDEACGGYEGCCICRERKEGLRAGDGLRSECDSGEVHGRHREELGRAGGVSLRWHERGKEAAHGGRGTAGCWQGEAEGVGREVTCEVGGKLGEGSWPATCEGAEGGAVKLGWWQLRRRRRWGRGWEDEAEAEGKACW